MKRSIRTIPTFSNWLVFISILFSCFLPTASAQNSVQTGFKLTNQFEPQNIYSPLNIGSNEKLKTYQENKKIGFEENLGQFNNSVRFVSKRQGQTIFLTADEAVFTSSVTKTGEKTFAMRLEIEDANKDSKFSGLNVEKGKSNYFRGKEKSKWQTGVSTYAKVKYEEIYQGIDLLWYNNDLGELEYDFVVAPREDYRQITLSFKGAKKLEINKDGDLLIHTGVGLMKQRKPVSYQFIDGFKQEVFSRYELDRENKVRFVIGDYDCEKELIIDPVIIPYSTFLGGSGREAGKDIAVDDEHNVYIVGTTGSTDFPTTSGAYDNTFNGIVPNVFVTKFDDKGALIYSTFLGGADRDGQVGNGIAVDKFGNAYIIGNTSASDFPTTPNAFSRIKKGGESYDDVFITKLNPEGNELVYSTFLGGFDDEEGFDISVDSNGNANLVGDTDSYASNPESGFPITSDSLPAHNDGGFFTKLNASGSALIYSTFLSGDSYDFAKKVVTDNEDSVYVLGVTDSNDFPITDNSFDTTHNGEYDIFVSKFTGSDLIYSTFLGGSGYDGINNGFGLAVDGDGNCYVLAPTGSDDFPTTEGVLDRIQNNYEAFVAKLNPQGSELIFSTFLSPLNNGPNYGYDLAVDAQSNIYVLGETGSNAFPNMDCLYRRYITQIAPDATSFKDINCFSNSFGDSRGLAIDSAQTLYSTGYSYINSYPTTTNAFDRTFNGDYDAVFTKHRFINTAIRSDFDADGKSDPSVYRNGIWYILQSSQGSVSKELGTSKDIPTPADFDGDGRTDIAVWSSQSTGSIFYFVQSSDNTLRTQSFGRQEDDPTVVGDYDGDGKADLAVYRNAQNSNGQSYFYFIRSSNNPNQDLTVIPWGTQGDKPVSGDYNADGKTDYAIFRPTQGLWYILDNESLNWRIERFGLATDKLVQGDYDGDAKTDMAVFRPSNGVWYIKLSSLVNGFGSDIRYETWGLETDVLIPDDYDGDGKTDVAVWRNGSWYIKQSSDGSANLGTHYGLSTDKPIQSFAVH